MRDDEHRGARRPGRHGAQRPRAPVGGLGRRLGPRERVRDGVGAEPLDERGAVRLLRGDLGERAALDDPEAHLAQILDDHRLDAQRRGRRGGGLLRAAHGRDDHRVGPALADGRGEPPGLLDAGRGQVDVAVAARIAVLRVPDGLAVPGEQERGRRPLHRAASTSGFARWLRRLAAPPPGGLRGHDRAGPLGRGLARPGQVRGHDHVRRRAQRVVGGQRLDVEHVEARREQVPVAQGGRQCRVVEQRAAGVS